jgi:hypothetical protein
VRKWKQQLSSQEYAGTQVAKEPIQVLDEEEETPRPVNKERTQGRQEHCVVESSVRRQVASGLMANRAMSKRVNKEAPHSGAAKKARTTYASKFPLCESFLDLFGINILTVVKSILKAIQFCGGFTKTFQISWQSCSGFSDAISISDVQNRFR